MVTHLGSAKGWANEPPRAPGCYNTEYFDRGKRNSSYHKVTTNGSTKYGMGNRKILFDSRQGQDIRQYSTCPDRVRKEILPGGGKLSGRAKASLSSSDTLKNERIYNSAPPWAFMCTETSLHNNGCVKTARPLPPPAPKGQKNSDIHSEFSTHVGAKYL